jgi:hypothetical protein
MEFTRSHHYDPGKKGLSTVIKMATISFGGAPGVYINEVAGQSATPAIADFSTVYMLVEVENEVPTTLFPFNTPVLVTNLREYTRLIGGVIPSTKLELLSYQCVDAFFAQAYVGRLYVIRVGTPSNVVQVQLNPSGYKTNGLGISSPLQAGDVVHAQLLINGARLGEFTNAGTWKGVPVVIPVDYVEGNYDNNKRIAIAIRDAIALAIATDPNVAAGTIVRDIGVCQEENTECALEYLAGREFNAPVSCVPESEPPSDGAYYVFTLNTYTVNPVIPGSDSINELLADYLQCLRTAFVDQEDQGYLTAPVAFAKFGPEGRRLVGQEMAFQAELNSHKWMAIADAGPYNVTDILEYQNFLQHEAAAPLVTGQEFLVGNSIYEWTADDTDYFQLRYTPLSSNESDPSVAVNGSKNTNIVPNEFLSLRDNGSIVFATSTTPSYDRPGLLDLTGENWPSTKEAGTPVVLSACTGALAVLEGETVYVVPTYLTPDDKTLTGYVYFSETYPQAITAYNWIISQGGLDGDGTPTYPGVNTLPPGCIPVDVSGPGAGVGDAVTGVVITNGGTGYNVGDEPTVAFPAPAAAGGVTATGTVILGDTGIVDVATVSFAGSGYTNTPVVNVVPAAGDPGAGATVTASLATINGNIAKLALTSGGSNYESAPTVQISAPAAAGGVAATATAALSPAGAIKVINLSNPGQNYTAAPSVSINGPGVGAAATASLATTNGVVVGIAGFGGGSLYQSVPTVQFVGTPAGAGATFSATLATRGSVALVNVSNGGSGYTLAPIVALSGDGAGATATATLATTGSAVAVDHVGGVSAFPTSGGTITLAGAGSETDIVLSWSAIVGGFIQIGLTTPGSGWTQANVDACLAGSYGTLTVSNQVDWITPPTSITVTLGFAVASVTVTANGSNYTSASVGFTNAVGDTTGAGAVGGTVLGYSVASIAITNGGSGYLAADPNVLGFVPAAGDTTGTGGSAVTLFGFALASVNLSSNGSGYDESTLLNVTNDPSDTTGSGAALSYTVGRSVVGLTLTTAGSGYATSDVVSVTFSNGNPTAAATATATKGFGVASVSIVNRGAGYLAAPSLQFVASPLDSGNTIVPATGTTTLGYGVTGVNITNAGSGYTEAEMPLNLTFSGGTPITPAQGYAVLQAKGTGIMSYETPAWDLYVEIDGQTSDLILNTTTAAVNLNTLHLPGTLQNSTENFNVAQFTRTFATADVTKLDPTASVSTAVFNCLNHGLNNGQVIYFTAPLTKTAGGSLVNPSTSQASVKYYVSVINGNQFQLATTQTNLNSRIFIQWAPLTAGQTTLVYSGLGIARENTSAYSNEGLVNLIRGRKYGFNTYNVLPTFYPANLDPLSGPAGQGAAHQIGFYKVENQVNDKYYSPYGEGLDAGFLGDLNLQNNETDNFFCVPLVGQDRGTEAYMTPVFVDGSSNKIVLWGAAVTMRYTSYKEAASNLWRFNAVTSEELVDYALRGTFNEGVPACVQLATGIDDAQKLLEDSQQYFNPRGFIAYYGPYLKNASGAWIPPSPYVTGVAIRRYRSEGFQYPPAGVKFPLNGVSEAQIAINSTQQDILNPKGCNVCRTLPGYGATVFIWGGRTRINQDDAEQRLFQFVNTRVIMNVVYGSLRRAFDSQIFNVIDGFGLVYNKIISIGNSILNELYVRGALFGKKPGDAFQVICDERIQTTASLESGIVHAKVFVVPVPTLERIEVDLVRVAIGNMQNELDAVGVGQDNAI